MKKMVKTVALMLTFVMSVGMLAGCGARENDKNEQGQTVISVGSWPTKEGVELDNMNARKVAFETANKDVAIEPDLWAFDLKTFYAKAAGGQLPTVFPSHFTEIAQIIDAEYSADITEVLKKRGYDGKFNEQILDLVSKDGKVYAFPTGAYVLGLAYNTDMFKKAGLMHEDGTPMQPKNWEEVAEFAVKIKEATGKPGFVFPTADNSGGWIFTSLAWSFGVDFMERDKDGKWKATFNTPETVEALQYIKDLKWKYDVLPNNNLINGGEYYKTFGVENAAMMITAGDYPGKVIKYGMTPEKIGMMAMPAGPKRHVTLMGGLLYCINEKSTEEQIDAAIRWLETEANFNATEDFKQTKRDQMKQTIENNGHVGIKSLSVWSSDAEGLAFEHSLIDENANANPNHIKLYNEFVADCPAEIQPEEPVCAQELYGILDGCIQEVLTNKHADVKKILEKANSDFQLNYLDNLTY